MWARRRNKIYRCPLCHLKMSKETPQSWRKSGDCKCAFEDLLDYFEQVEEELLRMSTEITILKPGTKVHYVPKDDFMSFENGIVKNAAAIPDCVWVVYSCNNDWNKYYAYSSALTEIKYLRLGWRS